MKLSRYVAHSIIGLVCGAALSAPVLAQKDTQFFPLLTFRTGAYAPSGVPWANGFIDYFKLVNAKGGINGVQVSWEECETGYSTDRGVECYERMKDSHGGATVFQTMSTGITFALTERGPRDKIPILTPGYGLSESADGEVFKWSFPLGGTHWASADTQFQYVAEQLGGLDNLKGKKITLLYHDSPYGKEAIPILTAREKKHGFTLSTIAVTHPGVDQKSAWLQIRQNRPDAVLLWGWGIMNSTALNEAQATGYPIEKLFGVWPSGSESDVQGVDRAKGYTAVLLLPGPGRDSKIITEVLTTLHDKGEGAGPREQVGEALYIRGLMNAMVAVEGVRRAQERFGTGQVMTSEQARWGYENMNVDEERLVELGIDDIMRPIITTCSDHSGPASARAYTWNGETWTVASDWLEADADLIAPMLQEAADRYAKEHNLTRRTADECKD